MFVFESLAPPAIETELISAALAKKVPDVCFTDTLMTFRLFTLILALAASSSVTPLSISYSLIVALTLRLVEGVV